MIIIYDFPDALYLITTFWSNSSIVC